ncbi:DUF1700 domain-containing protein [Bacillus mesophilum]|uniref:DUF1700 domain-containing protein n=2 Tax=Bacillus mesophilum TaxID=1071718 RepID=A0A7V7RHT1_9BACI|nr:DUF1700 domain-containing protein [Bacillus mesophilum]
MGREEYLKKLRSKIRKMPKEEIEAAIEYYDEYFEEAGEDSDDSVIKRLGSPSSVAAQILADHAVKDLDAETRSAKKSLSSIWFIILAIFAAPIGLPLLLVLFLLILTLIIVCAVTIFTLFLFVAVLPISGLFSIIAGFGVLLQHWQTSLFFIGIGSLAIGIGMLLYQPVVLFSKKTSIAIVSLLKRVFDKATYKYKGVLR